MLVFGPVPSRRLGRSLGINNIRPKTCSYSCVYCQVGRTTELTITRQSFYDPKDIVAAVTNKLGQAQAVDAAVDYLTIVPDGEPTLDLHIGDLIAQLRALGYKIAIITNASLLWDADVRNGLRLADWVSVKVDSVEEETWRRIDRPFGRLKLPDVLDGIQAFAQAYDGKLVSETMLVRDVNDDASNLEGIAQFLGKVNPACAYLSAPTRPPAESWVRVPEEERLHQAYHIFKTYLDRVEYLVKYEGDEFVVTDKVAEDLLNIVAVHPMREEAVQAFLEQAGAEPVVLDALVAQGALQRVAYGDHWFYVRRFSRRSGLAAG